MISNNSTMNKFGCFMLGCFIFAAIVSLWAIFFTEDSIGPLMGFLISCALTKGYLPWVQFKRRIYIDNENGKIVNSVGYKEDVKEKEYKISDIKDYSIIRIAAAKEIVAKDPTLIFPNDSSTRAFYSIGYIEFENGEILALDYGSKRKLKKKLSKFKSYVEE